MSLQSKIQSLIDGANAVTGSKSTDLTSAMQTLVNGYGSGGSVTPSVGKNYVTFIDYDGTILYSYSLEEA